MAEGNSILSTNTGDVERVNQLVTSNSVASIRTALAKTQRRILVLEGRIIDLANNEAIIKARIYSNVDQAFINSKYAAGINQQVQSVQSYGRNSISPDPESSFNSNKFKTYATTTGVVELDAELNRINNELNDARSTLRKYQRDQKNLDVALVTAQQKKSQNIFNKIGQVVAPSPEDIAKDQIAKSRVANLLLLQQLCSTYRNFATNPTTQQPGFPDEIKLPETLLNIRLKFWAAANQFHDTVQLGEGITTAINFIDPTSQDKLNFDNPGLEVNQKILDRKVDMFRLAGINTKVTADVSQFIKDNAVIMNDSLISVGIERKSDPTAPDSNSMLSTTKSYPAVAIALGNNYIGSFEIPTINDSIKKWWKKKNATFSTLPICPKVTKPSPTPTDKKAQEQALLQIAVSQQGADLFNKALEAAAAQQQVINATRLSDLPLTAPDWVKTYTSLHGNAFIGDITYPDTNNFNKHYVVTRAVSKNLASAQAQAEAISYPPTQSLKSPKKGNKEKSLTDPIKTVATSVNNYDFQMKEQGYVAFIQWQLNSEITQ